MAETILIDKNLSLGEQYQQLLLQIKSLLDKKENLISNLSNLTASLKHTFEKISWVGFYLFDGTNLYLGPFQGKVACTNIEIGKGVCGTSALKKETIIVQDVNKFPGHIFCDADSKSEIVVPILKDGNLFGVLDLDSAEYNSFDEIDKEYLEEIVGFLSLKIL
ncbi:MAG: GAF domain-containing protein [Bacteroidetes bacterium]|nr:GAF domain-containing protein [Bacteroidota bacterium]